MDQAACLICLADLFLDNGQSDAAEETITRSIHLVEKGAEFPLCQSHLLLGDISVSQGKREKAIHHYNTAIGIASRFNWHNKLLSVHYSLANLFGDEDKFDDAHLHLEQARQYAMGNQYFLGRVMEAQAEMWYSQGRYEAGAAEVLRAIEIYEKLGAARDLEGCRDLLRNIERAFKELPAPGESDSGGEFSEINLLPTPANFPFQCYPAPPNVC